MKQTTQRLPVAVLFGGQSAEHEISIVTALQAMQAIDTTIWHPIPVYIAPSGKWYTGEKLLSRSFYKETFTTTDLQRVTILAEPSQQGLTTLYNYSVIPISVCLLAFHGQLGEDGAIQGLLELANLAYTSCGPLASSVAMHKGLCKALCKTVGIPSLPHRIVTRKKCQEQFQQSIESLCKATELGPFPWFVKPCHLGSSIGISAVKDIEELKNALAKVFIYDSQALIEPCIQNPIEINISVMHDAISVPEIPLSSEGPLSYEDKYLQENDKFGQNSSSGMASLTRVINPKDLTDSIKEQVVDFARRAFTLIEAKGVVRFDFMLDPATEKLYFNELNPIPGSLSYYLWEKTYKPGKSPYPTTWLYPDVIDHILEEAIAVQKEKIRSHHFLGFTPNLL